MSMKHAPRYHAKAAKLRRKKTAELKAAKKTRRTAGTAEKAKAAPKK